MSNYSLHIFGKRSDEPYWVIERPGETGAIQTYFSYSSMVAYYLNDDLPITAIRLMKGGKPVSREEMRADIKGELAGFPDTDLGNNIRNGYMRELGLAMDSISEAISAASEEKLQVLYGKDPENLDWS